MYAAAGAFANVGYITFDWVEEPEKVAKDFFRAAAEVENMQIPLEASQLLAVEDMIERFDTHTSPDGAPWVEWSRRYEPIALATNLGGILERFLDLRGSATSPGAFLVTTDAVFFDVGTLPDYGIYHQTGTKARLKKNQREGKVKELQARQKMGEKFTTGDLAGELNFLPARPFIGPSTETQLKIIQVFDQWYDAIVTGLSTGSGIGTTRRRTAKPTHNLRWDANTGRWRDPRGRFAKAPK